VVLLLLVALLLLLLAGASFASSSPRLLLTGKPTRRRSAGGDSLTFKAATPFVTELVESPLARFLFSPVLPDNLDEDDADDVLLVVVDGLGSPPDARFGFGWAAEEELPFPTIAAPAAAKSPEARFGFSVDMTNEWENDDVMGWECGV